MPSEEINVSKRRRLSRASLLVSLVGAVFLTQMLAADAFADPRRYWTVRCAKDFELRTRSSLRFSCVRWGSWTTSPPTCNEAYSLVWRPIRGRDQCVPSGGVADRAPNCSSPFSTGALSKARLLILAGRDKCTIGGSAPPRPKPGLQKRDPTVTEFEPTCSTGYQYRVDKRGTEDLCVPIVLAVNCKVDDRDRPVLRKQLVVDALRTEDRCRVSRLEQKKPEF